jgi:hypothetical protein
MPNLGGGCQDHGVAEDVSKPIDNRSRSLFARLTATRSGDFEAKRCLRWAADGARNGIELPNIMLEKYHVGKISCWKNSREVLSQRIDHQFGLKRPAYRPGEAVRRSLKSMVNILPLSSNEISSPGSGF